VDIKLFAPEGRELPLRLGDLKSGAPGLTPAVGEGLAQAASVCLEDQGHSSPTPMLISGEVTGSAVLEWDPTSDQIRRNWNDDDEATEYGACAIASLLAPELSGLQVVERAKKGTGFDYWLGSADDSECLFQNRARLEVSGIRAGAKTVIAARVREKLRQVERFGVALLPALVVVVEFSEPESRVAKR